MTELPTEDFEEEWVNYGDVNPEPHGGRFVRWDPEEEWWEIVETVPADDASPDGREGVHIVGKYHVEPQDVWVNGDPENGFTDTMVKILESLGDEHYQEAPGAQPFMDRVEYYVADFIHYHRGNSSLEDVEDYEDYEALVAKHGVEDWE